MGPIQSETSAAFDAVMLRVLYSVEYLWGLFHSQVLAVEKLHAQFRCNSNRRTAVTEIQIHREGPDRQLEIEERWWLLAGQAQTTAGWRAGPFDAHTTYGI